MVMSKFICRSKEDKHVHLQESHLSKSEEKRLDNTSDTSDDSYSVGLPSRYLHMAYLKIKHNMRITLESVEKLANNVNKTMEVVCRLHDKVDEQTEIQELKGRGCGLSCTNNSIVL